MMMWGTTSPSAKLTDDSGTAFEAPLIGDCRLFRSLARNQPPRLLGLLQQYLPGGDIGRVLTIHARRSIGGSTFSLGRKERSSPKPGQKEPKLGCDVIT